MITRIISFHQGNLLPEVIKYQKKVFDHFNMPLEQIETKLSHAASIDNFLNTEEWDRVMLFDADCIPLHPIHFLYVDKIVGNAQRSSHIEGSRDFIAPSFITFTKSTWIENDKFSFEPVNGKGDVAELFSRNAEKNGIGLKFLIPLHVEKNEWKLDNGTYFGYGTTYGGFGGIDITYHAFESNAKHHSSSNFVKKCKEILGEI